MNKYIIELDYYYLTRGDRDYSEVVEVTKEIFDLLKPYENDLNNGKSVAHSDKAAYEAYETVCSLQDSDLRPSEINKIVSEGRYIYIAVC